MFVSVLFASVSAVCDGNPHGWTRQRRCDQYDPKCPDAEWQKDCGVCEGVGGLSKDDGMDGFEPTKCTPLEASSDPIRALWPKFFINDRFYEQQIFVRHDPFCLVQIPAMVSNGTHCFKKQQGTFNFDSTQGALRIDYLESQTTIPGTNMTEHFYHLPDGTVHPEITWYGVLPTPACPCINLGVGPVAYNWAVDALYVGRETLHMEFLWKDFVVDHWTKGPHHVWSDIATGNIVRLYQPYNGLEIFDPTRYQSSAPLPKNAFDLPFACQVQTKTGCINGTSS